MGAQRTGGNGRARLRAALLFSGYTSGKTHHFYHYPARFSPEFARTAIAEFSGPDDWVLDPFMGGGTAVVEGLTLGRKMVGVDLNTLAHFITAVRTTPLSRNDEAHVLAWASEVSRSLSSPVPDWSYRPIIRNLPRTLEQFLAGSLALVQDLPMPRQRALARCVLLRLGQWALESRDTSTASRKVLAEQLPVLVGSMLRGLRQFVDQCRAIGIQKNRITDRRMLIHRDTVGMDQDSILQTLKGRVSLVVTSPPYPGVHVLYHRWQLQGRRETPAPYWITSLQDGCGASFYTFGSRTPTGLAHYFATLHAAFKSVRPFLTDDALVLQLVAFADHREDLPQYLATMRAAGYREAARNDHRLTRRVPNRKWYARLRGATSAASEVLLVHKPI
jgi:hypothetical protein